ncbi:MAG: MoaD family protein [Actinobacteria bacterium]|nr:MoaD family protein [Actinomycetota bacterium]
MSVKVKVPTQLRNLTGGEAEVQADGSTLGDLVTDLESKHPGFKERILDESGSVRRFVNVYVNDEDVRFLDGLSTSVSEGATVSIIPAVAGG